MSKNQDVTIWGIHAGRTGDAAKLFFKESCIAVGWVQMGNLGNIKADREAFKEKVKEVYKDAKPGAIPNNAGQLFRFVHGALRDISAGFDRTFHSGGGQAGRLCA